MLHCNRGYREGVAIWSLRAARLSTGDYAPRMNLMRSRKRVPRDELCRLGTGTEYGQCPSISPSGAFKAAEAWRGGYSEFSRSSKNPASMGSPVTRSSPSSAIADINNWEEIVLMYRSSSSCRSAPSNNFINRGM